VVADRGTPGLELYPHLAGYDVLILVDVVKSKGMPGELRFYRKEEILQHPPSIRTSPHDPGVKESLLNLQLAGTEPEEVLLVGVIPDATCNLEVGLSSVVRAAVPLAVTAVLEELERLGIKATRSNSRIEPDIWWENEPLTDEGTQ